MRQFGGTTNYVNQRYGGRSNRVWVFAVCTIRVYGCLYEKPLCARIYIRRALPVKCTYGVRIPGIKITEGVVCVQIV